MATAVPSQQDVGRALRRARQRHHVQVDEAARETRIAQRYLEALESNAPLDTYPAPVYARAFLREYARFLHIDPEPLLAGFAGERPEEVPLRSIREAVPAPRRWPAKAVLGVSIAVLTGLAVIGVVSSRSPGTDLGTVVEHTKPLSPPPPAQRSPAPAQQAAFTGINANLHVIGRTWVEAVADGSVVFQGFWANHWHLLKASNELSLKLGNAAGVRILLNGHRIRTGGPGQVVRLSMSLQDGRVHVTRA